MWFFFIFISCCCCSQLITCGTHIHVGSYEFYACFRCYIVAAVIFIWLFDFLWEQIIFCIIHFILVFLCLLAMNGSCWTSFSLSDAFFLLQLSLLFHLVWPSLQLFFPSSKIFQKGIYFSNLMFWNHLF